jgi:hypothetical protein
VPLSVLGLHLVPEGPALSIRPDVRASILAGLSKLDESNLIAQLQKAERQARIQLADAIGRQAHIPFARISVYLHRLRSHTGRPEMPGANDPEEKARQRQTVKAVARRLGREVRPGEDLLIRYLRGKKTVEELAAILGQPNPAAAPN